MVEKWRKVLSQNVGIAPIRINSARVSAQNRDRYYWTNIAAESDGLFGDLVCKIKQPKDKGILLRDILESDVDEKYFLSEKLINGFVNHTIKKQSEGCGFKFEPQDGSKKVRRLRQNQEQDVMIILLLTAKLNNSQTIIKATEERNHISKIEFMILTELVRLYVKKKVIC